MLPSNPAARPRKEQNLAKVTPGRWFVPRAAAGGSVPTGPALQAHLAPDVWDVPFAKCSPRPWNSRDTFRVLARVSGALRWAPR